MNTCDTCRHYFPPEPYKILVGKNVETRTFIHGKCHNPALCLYYNNEHEGHEYSRLDGIMGHGARPPAVGPKFGCIHWEGRGDANPAMTTYSFSMDDVYILKASWDANRHSIHSIHSTLVVFHGTLKRDISWQEVVEVFLPMLEKMISGVDVVGEYEKMMPDKKP